MRNNKNLPRLKVKPGFENAALGLYLGKDYQYVLLGMIDGVTDQCVVCEISSSSRVIAGVNINGFEVVK